MYKEWNNFTLLKYNYRNIILMHCNIICIFFINEIYEFQVSTTSNAYKYKNSRLVSTRLLGYYYKIHWELLIFVNINFIIRSTSQIYFLPVYLRYYLYLSSKREAFDNIVITIIILDYFRAIITIQYLWYQRFGYVALSALIDLALIPHFDINDLVLKSSLIMNLWIFIDLNII